MKKELIYQKLKHLCELYGKPFDENRCAAISIELEKQIHFKHSWVTEHVFDEIIAIVATDESYEFKVFSLLTILNWINKFRFRQKIDMPTNTYDSSFSHIYEFFGNEVEVLAKQSYKDFINGVLNNRVYVPYELYSYFVEKGLIQDTGIWVKHNYKFNLLTDEIKENLRKMQEEVWSLFHKFKREREDKNKENGKKLITQAA